MGLDSVELILAIEEEFGIEIPDSEASTIATVGDVYELVKIRVGQVEPASCLSQRIFHKLRRGLSESYGVERSAITPQAHLSDFIPMEELKDGWPFFQLFVDLKTPSSVVKTGLFGVKNSNDSITIRELVELCVTLNSSILAPQGDTESEIWNRLVRVFVRQLNVRPEEVRPDAHIARHLGVD